MKTKNLADKILDTALQLADRDSWERTHLYDVAKNLNIGLDEVGLHYAQKDDIVEAWFDRADRILLSFDPDIEFLKLSEKERLCEVIMNWLNALWPYRKVTREMLYYKLEFGHIHLQVLGVLRISRTVQWFREAARIDSTNFRRILEEVATTTIYLITFSRWMFDDSEQSVKTRGLLEELLEKAEWLRPPVIS